MALYFNQVMCISKNNHRKTATIVFSLQIYSHILKESYIYGNLIEKLFFSLNCILQASVIQQWHYKFTRGSEFEFNII